MFTSLGGFRDFRMCHDLDFLLRAIFEKEVNFGVSSRPSWQYRCHESNSGSNIKLMHQQIEIALCTLGVINKFNRSKSLSNLKSFLDYGIPGHLVDLANSSLVASGNAPSSNQIQNLVTRLLTEMTIMYPA